MKRLLPCDPPWISKSLKSMLNMKNRLFKNSKKHGYKEEDKIRLDNFRIECPEAVETEILNSLSNLRNNVNDPDTSQKSYWDY